MNSAFALDLPGGMESARLARRAIAANVPTLPPSAQDDVSLLVTELATNAVRHGGAATDLVDRVAERWGVRPTPSGTCVWFELPAGVTA